MKKNFAVVFCFLYVSAHSQNMVDNGGFEAYSSFPDNSAQWFKAIGWSNCNGDGTPDYCHMNGSGIVMLPNSIFATLYPYEGDGIMGFLLWHEQGNIREYVSRQLALPLTTGESYAVTFYLTTGLFNGNYGGVGCDQMSVAFSVNPLVQSGWNPITAIPKYVMGSIFYDSTWQQFTFQFTADSAYNYITFGNFASNNNTTLQFFQAAGIQTCYYFLDGIEVLANNIFAPEAHFQSNDTAFCPNVCISFFDQSTNNPTSWQWSFPGGNPSSSSQQNPTNICYTNPGLYDVTLIASTTYASDTLTLAGYITVNAPTIVSISQSGNILTCNPSAAAYQWYLNGNQVSGATNQSVIISQTGTYTVEITDSNGCSSSADIIVTSFPSPDFIAASTFICEKFCIVFLDESTNNPTAWLWLFPGGTPSSSISQNPSQICYQIPGTYDVTLITTNASGNDTLTLLHYITVNPTPPIPSITQNGYTLSSTTATTYQWQFNSVDISGATSQSYDVQQSGYYTVFIADQNGCVSSTTIYILIEGIDEVNLDPGVLIYPNPSEGSFIIELSRLNRDCSIVDQASIIIYNTIGQIVFSEERNIASAHCETEIDLRRDKACLVSTGVFFVEIKSKDVFVQKKIIISE